MNHFRPGIDVLLSRHEPWLRGRRIGLVSHAAAVDSLGCTSAERLASRKSFRLVCLFSPEHGFFGSAPAGKLIRSLRHPALSLPVFSLYGETRKPAAAMLKNIDTLVFDMQDIGSRPYTYVSTLRYVLEAASESGKTVVVADRPVPLPRVVDGPVTEEELTSFVALVRTPMTYGMTPGETAVWLRNTLGLDLDLKIAGMAGYARQAGRGADWPPWIPPSPGIRTWESAACFPATVCFEALGAVDHGRATNLAFQVLGSPWIDGKEAAQHLASLNLPGVRFYPHWYIPRPFERESKLLSGVRMAIVDPLAFRPILTAVSIVHGLQNLYGIRKVWAPGKSRPEFFDKLFGTRSVREALLDGEDGRRIAARWAPALAAFNRTRRKCLLYGLSKEETGFGAQGSRR